MKHITLGIGIVLVVLVVGGAGYAIGRSNTPLPQTPTEHDCIHSYPMVNPYLSCEKAPGIRKTNFDTFRGTLNTYIEASIKANEAKNISVYVNDLVNGPTLGIEQNAEYQPVSLLKLPILMAYYKLSEEKPDILKQEFGFNGALDSGGQTIADEYTIKSGVLYKTEELLRRMIAYSDNRSKELLRVKLPVFAGDKDYLLKTYVDLGLLDINGTDNESITVKMYSSLFRLLFNASFVNTDLSNKALKLLSESVYTKGIVAGVPKGVVVAHKFGEGGEEGVAQLHDCGVVYFPGNPYSSVS